MATKLVNNAFIKDIEEVKLLLLSAQTCFQDDLGIVALHDLNTSKRKLETIIKNIEIHLKTN